MTQRTMYQSLIVFSFAFFQVRISQSTAFDDVQCKVVSSDVIDFRVKPLRCCFIQNPAK